MKLDMCQVKGGRKNVFLSGFCLRNGRSGGGDGHGRAMGGNFLIIAEAFEMNTVRSYILILSVGL